MSDTLRDALQRALGSAYRIDRELGGGGMSRVFVAHDNSLDREVVVKVLSGESTDGISGDRFRREIQVIAKLQHPHVVAILAAGEAEGALYYVMPFVKGETLRAKMVRDGAMSVAGVVKTLREVLDALAFAHEHGVVHRDIKPENILLEAGHALVADFGIAKALHQSGTMTSMGIAMGTPTYMAPEQATADPTTDHRADLYAVGVLAYEMLAGAPPFSGSTQQVITAHITTPAPPLRARRADVPESLAHVIASALAKEPSARPQSAREMLIALDAVQHSNGTVARSATAASPSWTKSLLAIATVAVLSTVGVYMWRSRATQSAVVDGADLIAVMPLAAASDTALARLGQDLVVTISANLDGVDSLRSIDAATLLVHAQKLTSPIPLAEAKQLAKELGARSFITGTLIREGALVRASVVLRLVATDSIIAKASALTSPSEIAKLTDSLSWKVLQGVWRRGNAPSPVLTDVTTLNFDALRAFLDGERKFQRLDVRGALPNYRRAFELDSNFVQAYLRFDYVNEWNLSRADPLVHRRLLALKDRLPERERLWVETRERAPTLPVPERVAEWRALVQRYPDYPPFLMAAADPIVHSGPIFGLPLTDATPFLDRLDELVPDHADTKLHQAAVASYSASPAEYGKASAKASALMSGSFASLYALDGEMALAQASGAPMPVPERALALARERAKEGVDSPSQLLFVGVYGFRSTAIPYQVELLELVRKSGVLKGDLERAAKFGESLVKSAQGNWIGALNAARDVESLKVAALAARMASARTAVMGAWLEAIDPQVADSTVKRVLALPQGEATALERTELLWMDGMMGVVLHDESRVQSALRALKSDTLRVRRNVARTLAGMWLHTTNPAAAADSLRAASDDMMKMGGLLLPAESLARLLIARSLRKSNRSAMAERYLMWPDAVVNTVPSVSASFSVGPFTEYERGAAFDALGNREKALVHYHRFTDNYVLPPPAHRAMVDDAKQRIAALEKTDATKAKSIPK